MSNSIAPGSSADVNVKVTALTTNPNVPVTYKTIILKKNLVNGVNTLTQEMMSNQNIKYVIKYDYVLGEDVTVPANCILEFDGGSISGEHILTGNNTGIQAGLIKIFNTNVTLVGTWNIAEAYPEWFGAIGDGVTDDTVAVQKVLNFSFIITKKDTCLSNKYKINATLMITRPSGERNFIKIKGGGKIIAVTGLTVFKATNSTTCDVVFDNIEIEGDGKAIDLENGKFVRLYATYCTFKGFTFSFYSSDIIQDLHISYCTFLGNTDHCIYGGIFYTTTIEYCVAENGNNSFLRMGNGYALLLANTLEGFESDSEPVVYVGSGGITAISNYVEYNKSNFITLGGAKDVIGRSLITQNIESNQRNTEPVVKLNGQFSDGRVTICDNFFANPAFANNSGSPLTAYNNRTEGTGKFFGKTLLDSSFENVLHLVENKTVFNATINAPLSGIDICKIDSVNSYIPCLIKVILIGSIVNVGGVYVEATYHGNTEISKTGSSDATGLISLQNNTINIKGTSSGNFVCNVVVEIYGKCYVTDYIN